MRKPEDRLLTIYEVSSLTGLSVTTIRNKRCQTGELIRIELKDEHSKKVTLRFSNNDVQAWIEKRKLARSPARPPRLASPPQGLRSFLLIPPPLSSREEGVKPLTE